MRQSKPTGGVRLKTLIEQNTPPIKRGVYIDTYNGIWNDRVFGTLKARIDSNCMYFVTDVIET